ncbi:MAG: hypothetical protein E7315_06340 [Clostridiales bacterium]|nr:hypothetical protein [Clostridiales bacterium]
MKTNRLLSRIIIYCVGIAFIAIGVSLAIRSDLGISPNSAVPYAMTLVTGMDIFYTNTIFSLALIAMEFVILRKDAPWTTLLQIICVLLFSALLGISNNLFAFIVPANYFMQILLCLGGAVFIALGIYLYVVASLISMPAEGIVQAIDKKSRLNFSTIKVILDCTYVLIAAVVCLVFTGELKSVREGTIILAVSVGPIIKCFSLLFDRFFIRLGFKEKK